MECESNGFEVHAVVADGHPTNRKLFKIMSGCKEIPMGKLFMAPNPASADRNIYFLSDPSHLLKVSYVV